VGGKVQVENKAKQQKDVLKKTPYLFFLAIYLFISFTKFISSSTGCTCLWCSPAQHRVPVLNMYSFSLLTPRSKGELSNTALCLAPD